MRYLLTLILCSSQVLQAQDTNTQVTPFLESIVQQFPNVRDLALTTDNTEAVFSIQSVMGDISALAVSHYDNSNWNDPQLLKFSGNYSDLEPYFSRDGLRLYFVSNRPITTPETAAKDFDIWYVERKNRSSAWSDPINLGAPINTEMDEFYPVITNSGNLYFTLDNTNLGQKDDIYVSKYLNGAYQTPERLDAAINSDGYEFNAYVSLKEDYIIYTCYNREGGLGSGDLYISYKGRDGHWMPAENMGAPFNSDKMDYCPFVDEARGVLYFTSKRLSSVKLPTNFNSIEALKLRFTNSQNGSSRLYQIPFSVEKD